ncbi:down syndrome cell adhesion molecule-like protein Dscam2 [Trichonephila clavata]|uniref:Down syndrome cell adhesion molecule-like protein Dscam2 n=1 Tax=Trichonephila clavata TaxID=2740835 RepID=A0A8X6KJC6_TRICU|nr:down syndrome cell adhesion molecule-like protein Dscam2 [Trichonephila clavata]
MRLLSANQRAMFPTPTSLQVRQVKRQDSGIYQCFVNRDEFSAQASSRLLIGETENGIGIVVAGWMLRLQLLKGNKAEQSNLNFRGEVTLSLLRMKPKINSVPGPHIHSSKSLRQMLIIFFHQHKDVVLFEFCFLFGILDTLEGSLLDAVVADSVKGSND